MPSKGPHHAAKHSQRGMRSSCGCHNAQTGLSYRVVAHSGSCRRRPRCWNGRGRWCSGGRRSDSRARGRSGGTKPGALLGQERDPAAQHFHQVLSSSRLVAKWAGHFGPPCSFSELCLPVHLALGRNSSAKGTRALDIKLANCTLNLPQ